MRLELFKTPNRNRSTCHHDHNFWGAKEKCESMRFHDHNNGGNDGHDSSQELFGFGRHDHKKFVMIMTIRGRRDRNLNFHAL